MFWIPRPRSIFAHAIFGWEFLTALYFLIKDNKYNNLLFFMISGPDLKYLLNKNGMNNVLVEVTRGQKCEKTLGKFSKK